jgi:hypothetical protein
MLRTVVPSHFPPRAVATPPGRERSFGIDYGRRAGSGCNDRDQHLDRARRERPFAPEKTTGVTAISELISEPSTWAIVALGFVALGYAGGFWRDCTLAVDS